MAYKFNNALRHLTSNKHSLSTNTSFRKLQSSNISFSRSNSPPLSEEEDELLKISINEYKDLFPKIIQIPHNEFISTLERYIIISLKGKLSFPSGSLSKILSIIKHKYYEPDYIKIKSYITQTSSSLLKLDNCAMYIPHCLNNKTSKHKCGNALYFISPSHLFCKSCNLVYTTSSFSLYCEYCKVEYYTTLLDKQAQNKQFKQATWNKYHCDVLFVQPMKCPKCKDVLYINTKNNKLTCLECKYEFEQDKIISRCVVCNDNFVSEVKVYNSIEYKNVALAIKEAIFNSKEARPDYLPCCNTKDVVVDEMKFVHKKECNGVLYEGKLNDKRIVVCSCCHLLSYRENHFWMCPICKERFKLDANYVHDKDITMYRKINVNKQIANAGSRIRKDIRIGRGRYNSEIITEDNYNTSLLNRQGEGNVQSQGNNNNNNSRDNYNSNNNNNTSGNVVNNRSGILHARYLSIFNSKLNNSNNNNNNNSANVNVSDALRENSPTPSNLNMKKINPLYIKHYKDKPNINIPEHKHYHHLSQLNSNYHTDTPKMSIETPMKLERHSIAPNPSVSVVSNNPNLRSSRFNIQSKRENSNKLLCSFLERSQHNASSNININFNVNITANNMIINNSSLLHKNRPLTEANTNSKFNSDQYTIIKQIGEGTFGKIYEVKNKYNKHFAMKKILTSNPHDIEALSDEYKMLISLNNLTLHLVKIFGMHSKQLDKTTYVMYVLMELASYDWEKEICNRKAKNNFYTEKELMHILKQLSITLAELQLRKISHRDIKPQNILIFNENVYKIADFGEAKTNINYSKSNYNVKDTTTQTIRGTELYMSPLLFKALKKKKMTRDKYIEHNTYKSDVFSLGLCMFLASTLNMQSLVDIREIDMTSSIKLIVNRWLKGRYSKRYVDILMKMLEVNEKKRVDFIELKNEVMNYIN